jgi:hypothetical protein
LYGLKTEELMRLPLLKCSSNDQSNLHNSSGYNLNAHGRSSTKSKTSSPAQKVSPYTACINPADLLPSKRDTSRKLATNVHPSIKGATPNHIVSPFSSAPNSRSVSVVNSVANSPMGTPRRAGGNAGDDPFSSLSMDILTYEYTGLVAPRTPLGSVSVNGISGISSSSGSGKGIASPKRNVLARSPLAEGEEDEVYADDYEQEE